MDPVLIVDDEKDNLEALRRLLRSEYAVTVSNSPFEALKLVQKNEYHVIISDQRMAEMTGVELLEKVKNVRPATARILLTGYTDIESVIGAINRGNIYRYVAKPWDPAELRLTLRQANESYRLKRELENKNEALEKSNQELKQALEDLRLLDRAKARFLSLISHELNTPLTVLNAFVSLLIERREGLPKDVQKSVDSIAAASARFADIVAEVLIYVKLESENRLVLTAFDFGQETAKIKDTLQDTLAKKKLRLTLLAKYGGISRCDADKMRLALQGLLEDAIVRTPVGQEIKVQIDCGEGIVRYSVWRSGEPLSADAFEPLAVPSDPLHHHRNLGLGLAICRHIVESHEGKMSLKSTVEEGTTISFTLPQAPGI
jgi:signal transduction histidine kinase